ncbi:diacylglycerol/lipid kinase family protein [Halobacterium litoreum]|uniref:Diacylglycerol/lipid kinase family protein n=1 Tax=Halobacterium litoreum TaxID=2039234 RepID=A0ABD5NH04_9EURY|nr:diacylglycerol kinase family protein [Halobacterium litoreum]UHH12819.1 diacylglycerol kinase family lipid kinase [Halobacterium litoreum]
MQVGSRRCIVNPVSGTGDHTDYVRRLMAARGFEVVETTGPEDAARKGLEAGRDDVSELAVCGGDGTVNDVLRGLASANHLGDVTLSVVPAGTANILAGNVGVRDIEHGVEVADTGDVRTVDLGVAGDEPFAVSCIAGLPADASVAASGDLKERFGTLAFLLTGAQEALQFDALRVTLEDGDGGKLWSGEALCVLVGNARRFVEKGGQANMEDGRFDVVVVEQMPNRNLVAESVAHRLLGRQTDGVTHLQTSDLRVASEDGPITFSRDGELSTHEELAARARPSALDLRVGPAYAPDPT